MTVKEHYDTHLGNFYAWMLGDFDEKKNDFLRFCREAGIIPFDSKTAIDLGAGNGIQSVAPAMHVLSPVSSRLESVVESWLKDLFIFHVLLALLTRPYMK